MGLRLHNRLFPLLPHPTRRSHLARLLYFSLHRRLSYTEALPSPSLLARRLRPFPFSPILPSSGLSGDTQPNPSRANPNQLTPQPSHPLDPLTRSNSRENPAATYTEATSTAPWLARIFLVLSAFRHSRASRSRDSKRYGECFPRHCFRGTVLNRAGCRKYDGCSDALDVGKVFTNWEISYRRHVRAGLLVWPDGAFARLSAISMGIFFFF